MSSKSHKSAELANVEGAAISAAATRSASEPAMGSYCEPTIDASVEYSPRQRGNGRGGRKAGGALDPSFVMGSGESRSIGDQRVDDSAKSAGQIPHGVESDPTAGKEILPEPGTHGTASFGMTGTISDRGAVVRSPHSSRRTGKPSTGRRGAVDTASRQEGDGGEPSTSVNTEGILDMQGKLYRWSRSNPDRVFSDLFNLVCDRRTLHLAWTYVSRNRGSRTPGIDGATRRRVEEGPGGVAGFLEELREQLRTGQYQPVPVREKLIPKPGKPARYRRLGIPSLRDRLVQMALKIVLEPIFEAGFSPVSYGFRRGRSTLDALAMIQRHGSYSRRTIHRHSRDRG